MKARVTAITVFLALTAVVTGGAWWLAFSDSLTRLEDRGRADLALAGDRLTAQLQRYREMAVMMADHPLVQDALASGATPGKLHLLLQHTADFTGSPQVTNGASDLMVEVFGDKGRHARAAVSCPALPRGVAVEMDAILEIE